jgi:hypothetical protein
LYRSSLTNLRKKSVQRVLVQKHKEHQIINDRYEK